MTARHVSLSAAAIVVLVLVVTGCATTPEDDMSVYEFNEGMEVLGSSLKEGYDDAAPAVYGEEAGRKRLAVLRLVNDDGTATPIGREVANGLQVQLFDPERFSLLERERVDSLLGEFSFGETGLVQELSTSELGNLLGAEVVVVGTVRAGAETATVSARLVDLESGEILGIGQVVVYTDFIDIDDVRDTVDGASQETDSEVATGSEEDPDEDPEDDSLRGPEAVFDEFQYSALYGDLDYIVAITDIDSAVELLDLGDLSYDEVVDYLYELYQDPDVSILLEDIAGVAEIVGGEYVEEDIYSMDLDLTLQDETYETYVDFFFDGEEWTMDVVGLLLDFE